MSRRLPDDPAYWEGLARRVEAAAWAQRNGNERPVVAWLAARVPAVGVSALAAAAAALLWVQAPPAGTVPEVTAVDWAAALAPNDSLGRELSAGRPPALGRFVGGGSVVSDRRRQP